MTSDELYDLFRKDVVDTARPYLWSDEEVWAYMNDAYTMFVRLTGGVPSVTADICTIPIAVNEPTAEISDKILLVRTATRVSDGADIRVINAQDTTSLNDEDFGVLRRINVTKNVGKVRYMIIGMERGLVRWVNIPDGDDAVNLLVERLPLDTISGFGQNFTDVQDHHHIHFLKWMRHLAYNKQDAETFNKAKSDAEQMSFQQYCEFAKREKERAKHKVRVVKYGGI